MRAVLTAVVAAIEACAVALAGIVLVAIPAVLLWWLSFGFAAEPSAVMSSVSSVWLLAHFVPTALEISPETALGLGLPPQALVLTISLAPLGLTLLTVLLAFRAGWRFAGRGGSGVAGVIGGALGFAAAVYAILLFGSPATPWPDWAVVLVPALCFAVGGAVGFVWCSALEGHPWWRSLVRRASGVDAGGPSIAAWSLDVLRFSVAALAGLLGLGALGFAVAIVAGYVEIVTMSQALQLDPLGIVLMFLLSIVLLPVAAIWSVAWLSGSGFAIGTGTWVSPFDTLLGPIPALPMLGAVPESWGWAAPLAPLIVVVLGVAIGAFAAGSPWLRAAGWGRAVGVAVLSAAAVGLAMSALSALASGSIGPGRLAQAGPDPWLTGALVAGELGLGAVLGVIARRADSARRGAARLPETAEPRLAPAPASSVSSPVEAEAETVPLEPLAAPVAAGERSPAAPPTEAETVPLEPLPAPPVAPTPQAASVRADPPPTRETPRAPALPTGPQPPVAAAQPVLDADADSETIARAYAWDENTDMRTEAPSETKRSRWRRPRRDG